MMMITKSHTQKKEIKIKIKIKPQLVDRYLFTLFRFILGQEIYPPHK